MFLRVNFDSIFQQMKLKLTKMLLIKLILVKKNFLLPAYLPISVKQEVANFSKSFAGIFDGGYNS